MEAYYQQVCISLTHTLAGFLLTKVIMHAGGDQEGPSSQPSRPSSLQAVYAAQLSPLLLC